MSLFAATLIIGAQLQKPSHFLFVGTSKAIESAKPIADELISHRTDSEASFQSECKKRGYTSKSIELSDGSKVSYAFDPTDVGFTSLNEKIAIVTKILAGKVSGSFGPPEALGKGVESDAQRLISTSQSPNLPSIGAALSPRLTFHFNLNGKTLDFPVTIPGDTPKTEVELSKMSKVKEFRARAAATGTSTMKRELLCWDTLSLNYYVDPRVFRVESIAALKDLSKSMDDLEDKLQSDEGRIMQGLLEARLGALKRDPKDITPQDLTKLGDFFSAHLQREMEWAGFGKDTADFLASAELTGVTGELGVDVGQFEGPGLPSAHIYTKF